MNEYIASVVLGVVEGLTEFIPVSSTGHLIIAGELIGFTGDRAKSFEIFIQLGAILAIVWLYWGRFVAMLPGKGVEGGLSGFTGVFKLVTACVPAGLLGITVHGYIKEHLFTTYSVALALVVGGIAMLLAEGYSKAKTVDRLDHLTYRHAFAIGCFQCLSLWPGMSRSASTIVGGMLVGLDRRTAAEFSFLVAVPIMFAATGFDLARSASVLGPGDLGVFALGFVVSFVSAIFAVRFFMRLLGRWTLAPFAWYRIAVGAVLLLAYSR